MSFSNRMYNAALRGLLVLTACLVLADEGHAQGNNAAPPQQGQHQQAAPQIPTPPQDQAVRPKYYDPTCSRPADRDDANFCEQRRAADAAEQSVFWAGEQSHWTKEQAIWAERSLYVGAAGVVLVVVSLIFTGAAVWATTEANKQGRELFILSNRPQVGAKGMAIRAGEAGLHFEGRRLMVPLSASFKNTGNSAAIVRFRFKYTVAPPGKEFGEINDGKWQPFLPEAVILPDVEIEIQPRFLLHEPFKGYAGGRYIPIICVETEYWPVGSSRPPKPYTTTQFFALYRKEGKRSAYLSMLVSDPASIEPERLHVQVLSGNAT